MGSSVILPVAGQPIEGPDPGFTSASQPSAVQFLTTSLPPPAPVYLTRDDQLHLVAYNSFPGAVINVNARILLPAGTTLGQPLQPDTPKAQQQVISVPQVVPLSFAFAPDTTRSANKFLIPLHECFLLGIQCFQQAATAKRGQTFVYLELLRGPNVAGVGVQTLFADYLPGGIALGWPGGQIRSSIESPGWVHEVAVANPAAGADFTTSVPTSARWQILSARMLLTTSATVANRIPHANISDGVNLGHSGPPNAVIPASSTNVNIEWTAAITAQGTNVPDVMVSLAPDIIAMTGWSIFSSTANLQAGDQYSSIVLEVMEWVEP